MEIGSGGVCLEEAAELEATMHFVRNASAKRAMGGGGEGLEVHTRMVVWASRATRLACEPWRREICNMVTILEARSTSLLGFLR